MTQLDAERRQVLRLGRIANQAGELVGGFQFEKVLQRFSAKVAARACYQYLAHSVFLFCFV